MSKRKKAKDPWLAFVNKIYYRPRAKREYKVPMEYVSAVANQLWKTNPSEAIVRNTLVEFWKVAAETMYMRSLSDRLFFKEKRRAELDYRFKDWLSWLDDLTHDKEGKVPNYAEWREKKLEFEKNQKKQG